LGEKITSRAQLIADVSYAVSAKQGPDDPKERAAWLTRGGVRAYYESHGYQTKMNYRHLASGGVLSGNVHKALAARLIL